ncbi:hypothetical protein GCM10023115_32290 [Pontixanthobacter gangjinensis]|uniref:PorT family protein n=1 Tax=Christiangramia aestuarii TaxID=1028746 RepID=A0A7K1LNT4_9FLAO|nr:porin family protein [Christiangramia aestuarii]MUP42459.1 PorT family protein [Christiangramia aestuarii]
MKFSDFFLGLLLFLVCLSFQTARSQSDIGFKAGVTAYGFHKQKSVRTDEIGFSAGITYQKEITRNLNFRPELLFTKKGGWVIIDFGTGIKEDLYYVDLPILLSWEFMNNFSLQAGPQLGLLVAEKSADKELPKLGANIFNMDASGGFLWEISRKINLGARYSYGLTKIFENYEYRNSVIALSIGYNLY